MHWNVEEGHISTVQEARERLEYFQANGATDFAFNFKNKLDHRFTRILFLNFIRVNLWSN